ncbi:MAG: glycosyltransferase [bacterium]|nr:glycosyltransferase [bacterium]
MRVVNLLSTYNEKENIGPMVEFLDDLAKKLPKYEFVNLVVDSHSPDGTGDLVKDLAKSRKNLHLLETPRGLGLSLVAGFKYAINELKADIVVPNDVDFQWNPKYIPEMLAKIEEGFDVVVPSRHMIGSKDNFNSFRKLTHFVSNTLINYYWGGINQVKDLAGNFKAIRVKGILDKVDLDKINVKGFVIQSTIIYELSKTGAKFCEIPAVYEDRRAGVTKVGLNIQFVKDVIETFINATKIRAEKWGIKRFLKFGIVGFTGYLINAAGLEFFYRLGFHPGPAASMAAEIAVMFNFTMNNFWTFGGERITGWRIVKKFIQFNVTSIGAILIQGVAVGGLAVFFGEAYRQIYLFFVIPTLVLPYNYSVYNIFIWKTWKIPFLSKFQKVAG